LDKTKTIDKSAHYSPQLPNSFNFGAVGGSVSVIRRDIVQKHARAYFWKVIAASWCYYFAVGISRECPGSICL